GNASSCALLGDRVDGTVSLLGIAPGTGWIGAGVAVSWAAATGPDKITARAATSTPRECTPRILSPLILGRRTRRLLWRHGLSALTAVLARLLSGQLAGLTRHLQAGLKLAIGRGDAPRLGFTDAQLAIGRTELGPFLA